MTVRHVWAVVNTGILCSVVLYECHCAHGAEGVVRRRRKPPHWNMLWSTDVLMLRRALYHPGHMILRSLLHDALEHFVVAVF